MDPVMMGPVKAIPEQFSCWNKTHLGLEKKMNIGEIM